MKVQSVQQSQEDINMKEKVVLAYSGGLDTTAIIPWLKEHFGYEVICCCIDCGQGSELDGLDERAKLSGASKLYIEDLVDGFCDNYIMPSVLPLPRDWLILHVKKAPQPSATALPARAMTRFVLSWVSRLWPRISRSSLPGV